MSLSDGKELLRKSIKSLNDRQNGEAGGNRASCPVVVIFMGELCAAHKDVVKGTLELNWINARYLQYIKVTREGNTWIGECQIDSKSVQSMEFEEMLNFAIDAMLSQEEKIFRDRNNIKLDFVLDATEENAEDFFQLYLDTHSKGNANDLKSMFLMLNQENTNNKVEMSEKMLQTALKKIKDSNDTVYLVSNLTKGNYMLNNANIWKNYRLISDVILLSGSCKEEERFKFYNSVKTLAYVMVTKPIDEIAYVSLNAFLERIYEVQEKKCNEQDFSDKELQMKIKLAGNGEYGFARELFEKYIQSNLPSVEAIRYLPFDSMENLKRAQKGMVDNSKELDRITGKAWDAYVQRHYKKILDDFLDSATGREKCREMVKTVLLDSFSFFEYLRMAQDPLQVERVFKGEYKFTGGGIEGWKKFHNIAVYECKLKFYEEISVMLWETLQENIEAAQRLDEYYKQIRKEVEQEHIVADGENYGSLKQLYFNIVYKYIQERQIPNAEKSWFDDIFCVDASKTDLVTSIWKEIENLFCEKTYSLDFESELDMRIKDMEESENVQAFVTNTLQKKSDNSIRLKNCVDINSVFSKAGSYCLINLEARYAKYLADRPENGTEYVLFGLNRTDCVEQIEIWNITQTDNIHLLPPDAGKVQNNKRSFS